MVSLNDTIIDDRQEIELDYGVGMTIYSALEFTTVVSSITSPPPYVLTLLRQYYDFVKAGCQTKISDKEERWELDQGQGQVQSHIYEKEEAQEQNPGPG